MIYRWEYGGSMPRKEIEKEPVLIRIPKKVLEKIDRYAKENYMDRADYIRLILAQHVKEKEKAEMEEIKEKIIYYLKQNSKLRKEIKKILSNLE